VVRTQIQLEEAQYQRLKEAARRESVSLAEMIRRCVERGLPEITNERAKRYAHARAVLGRFHSGRTDTAERHDDALAEAYR
jgi:predicted DNA-binding ribbon-helix-helix protein